MSRGVPARVETSETEVLITWGEAGTTAAGLAEMLSTALTVALLSGVPAYPLVEELLGLRFVPHGRTGDPLVPFASSVADHVARHLAIRHLTPEERRKLGVFVAADSPWPDAYTQAPDA